MQATGTVTFFLYFECYEHAESARSTLLEAGYLPHPCDAPEEGEPAWSVLADRDMADAEVADHFEVVRTIAVSCNGRLDGIATPWPGHPLASTPQR